MKFPRAENMVFPLDIGISPHLYYSKIFGFLYRHKSRMLIDFLPKSKTDKILEVGFGSGIALKELSKRAEKVCGVDIHEHIPYVEEMLIKEDLHNIQLFQHNIFQQPFLKEENFDYVIASSVLEHIPIEGIHAGVANMFSCLKEGGYLLAGFPLKTPIMNALFELYEKIRKKMMPHSYDFSLKDDHPSGQDEIVPILRRLFTLEDEKFFLNKKIPLYVALKCKKS